MYGKEQYRVNLHNLWAVEHHVIILTFLGIIWHRRWFSRQIQFPANPLIVFAHWLSCTQLSVLVSAGSNVHWEWNWTEKYDSLHGDGHGECLESMGIATLASLPSKTLWGRIVAIQVHGHNICEVLKRIWNLRLHSSTRLVGTNERLHLFTGERKSSTWKITQNSRVHVCHVEFRVLTLTPLPPPPGTARHGPGTQSQFLYQITQIAKPGQLSLGEVLWSLSTDRIGGLREFVGPGR